MFAHTRGDSSSPESTIAQSRESAMFNSAHTSAEELSILCRVDNVRIVSANSREGLTVKQCRWLSTVAQERMK